MEQLVDEGLVLSIGLQDADIEDVTAVMEYARITPAVNSLEVHPGNRNDALLAFCRSQVSASKRCSRSALLQLHEKHLVKHSCSCRRAPYQAHTHVQDDVLVCSP